ncbi:hypothetical protein BDQ17DRAFT_1333026 [Cyathus striatus]|nr:hypothetical protein BDQ17DRAFT_1333026 [Cyathus striatus]
MCSRVTTLVTSVGHQRKMDDGAGGHAARGLDTTLAGSKRSLSVYSHPETNFPPQAKFMGSALVNRTLPASSPPLAVTVTNYQHYIPKFILRRFQAVEPIIRSQPNKNRQRQYKEDLPVSKRTLVVYDVSRGVLEPRSPKKVYGETNLYRDVKNMENFNHIEQKLSRLEGRVLIYITRRELGNFRRFLYLMQLRASHRSITYWKEDHPPLRDWIKKRKEDKGLKDDVELWKDAIQYHLDHPHHVIIAEGEAIVKHLGGRECVTIIKNTRVDPSINWYALEYEAISNAYFMGIWEAADGSEFILGNNSFGLWEGLSTDGGQIHRIYILSPRLVVILRSVFFRSVDPECDFPLINGKLIYIPIKSPTVHFASFITTACGHELDDELLEYRVSNIAQNDVFTFNVTKLTKAQTQVVNDVVLHNVDNSGSVTFASRRCMLDTLQAYYKSDYDDPESSRYNSLLIALLQPQRSRRARGSIAELYAAGTSTSSSHDGAHSDFVPDLDCLHTILGSCSDVTDSGPIIYP